MGRYQKGSLRKRFGSWHLRYYVTEQGERKPKEHRLSSINDGANRAKQLAADSLHDHVNVGVNNSGPRSVVDFGDRVYKLFLDSHSNLKPSTIHGYKQIWKQHLKAHFGETNLTDYTTPMMSNFLSGLAKTLRPRTLKTIKWLASAIFVHAVPTDHCATNPIRDAQVLGKTLPDGKPGSTRWKKSRTSLAHWLIPPWANLSWH
jgi:hypothetical protein